MREHQLFSQHDMARALNVPPHRVRYVVKTRSIKPAQHAGGHALYDASAFRQVEIALLETTERWKPVADRPGAWAS